MIRSMLSALVLLTSLVQGQGQSIDLMGVVRDRASGLGISEVEVTLLHRGLKDTSDSQGQFHLDQAPPERSWLERFGKADSPVFLLGRGILIHNTAPGPVHLRILDITGKIYGNASANLGTGIWLMNPGRLEPGAYFGIVNTITGRQSFRFVALNSPFGNASVPPTLLFDESRPLSNATANTLAVDSIKVVKTGYFSTVFGITSFIDSNLVIELDAPSSNADKWIDSWAASFLSTTVNGHEQSTPSFNNQTYRLSVFSKLGGTQARVKFTNKFATNNLTIGAAHIAICSTNNSIVTASDRTLTFGGKEGVTLAPGAEIWSDSVVLTIAQHVTVAISVYIPEIFNPTTFHPTGLHTSYLSGSGDFTASTTLPLSESSNTTTQVVMVSGLQVWAPSTSEVAIAFGNSITDGAGAINDDNGTWPDVLSKRLPVLSSGAPFAVINMGIGSNRVVSSDLAGPSGVHRFADDVLARPNVKYVILLEGINDISYEQASDTSITNAYATMISESHAAGIKVYGATLLPIGNSIKYTVANETTRQAVNAWIRTPGNFDAVLDFEAVVGDTTTNPLRIKSDMTFDYVHPNALGYQAIGNSIPTGLFK